MSQENGDLARRVYDAIARRDLDAVLAFFDPDVEAEPTGGEVFGTSHHGHDRARRFWNELFSAFPDYSAEVLEVRDLGTWCSQSCANAPTAQEAKFRWSRRCGISPSGVIGRSSGGAAAPASAKPSKPSGCGSRRSRGEPQPRRSPEEVLALLRDHARDDPAAAIKLLDSVTVQEQLERARELTTHRS
jgi:hypothetical protein